MYVDREFNIRVDKSNFPIIKNSIHHLALDANISFYNYSKNKNLETPLFMIIKMQILMQLAYI